GRVHYRAAGQVSKRVGNPYINVIGFECFDCARQFRGDEVEYVCAACGGNLDVLYDYDYVGARLTKARLAADRDFTMWRYRPLLPVADGSAVPPLAVGWTPLYDCPRLASRLSLKQLLIKD